MAWFLLAWFWLVLATVGGTAMCRSRDGILLDKRDFTLHTCVLCYSYLHNKFFENGRKLRVSTSVVPHLLIQENNSLSSNLRHPEVLSFLNFEGKEKWEQCCEAAVNCCESMSASASLNVSGWCPRTWDGWQCWPDSPPGSVQSQPCPSHSYLRSFAADDCMKSAKKTCEPSGHWHRNKKSGHEWTNYRFCSSVAEFKRRETVSVIAFAVSIAAIVPSLFIFQTYRQLHSHRITLHKNLFYSLLLHAALVITFKMAVILREFKELTSFIAQNSVWCKSLVLLTKYFRLSNYMWMFCEGFYLHRFIASAFSTEENLTIFFIIGWGYPVLPVVAYAILRSVKADSDCWALPVEIYEWLLYLPCLGSLLVNCIFLVNIIRILLMKLRTSTPSEPTHYRKAVRATLLLVPLFGVHFLFTLYRPQSQSRYCDWIEVYMLLDRLLDGLQGAIVAIFFCFTNQEVHSVLRRSVRNAIASHIVGPSSTHTLNSL